MMWDKKTFNHSGFGATPVVFILVPLISLGGFLLFSTLRSTHAPEIKPIAMQERSPKDDLSVDSDQDGLKDWEEQIYGTNSHNPNTDGDEIKDGDEIAQNRDPLKLGPDDYLTKKDTSLSSPSSIDDRQQQNLTKRLAEVFGTDYLLNLVQDPQSQPDVDAIADKMAQITLDQPLFHAPAMTASDIIISHNATLGDVAQYINQFNAILLNPLKPLPDTKSISDAIANIVHTEDVARTSAATSKLAIYIEKYDGFFTDIRTISVPEIFVSLHLDYLNTAIKEREALKKIQNVKSDPFTALLGFREYGETTTRFNDLRKQYIELEITMGIIPLHK